jgi:hypothetical protein
MYAKFSSMQGRVALYGNCNDLISTLRKHDRQRTTQAVLKRSRAFGAFGNGAKITPVRKIQLCQPTKYLRISHRNALFDLALTFSHSLDPKRPVTALH